MRAISYTENGPATLLHLVEREVQEPTAGEVLVRIAVSGVNPTDWKSRAGSKPGERLPSPQIPNQDGAGIVHRVGADVTGLSVGQRVWVWEAAYHRAEGTAQEFALLPESHVVALPDDASFDLGASVGIPALTAHRALTVREDGPARLSPDALVGTTVLVAGGAGAVAHAAIQLAVWAGGTVVTTVSSDAKAALALAAGAHHVINYRLQNVAAEIANIAPDGVDIIVEVAPGPNAELDGRVIASGGTVAIYASGPTGTVTIPDRGSMTKNVRYQFILTYTTSEAQKRDAVDAVSAAIAAGALGVGEEHGLPLIRFPLEKTADAHDAVENQAVGKVLVDVATL